MTFAAPVFVWAAAAAAVVAVALHLLAWRRPPETPLPTARFVPDTPVQTVSRAIRPSDLVLLALRVGLVLLVGTALGRPQLRSREPGVGHVVVVDRSRGPRVGAAVADSARRQLRPGDVLVTFDSAARVVSSATPDSLAVASGPPTTGSLSAGLVAAIRAAHRLARNRDSVEIIVVSPFDVDELDAATATIRQRWAGGVRGVRAAGAPDEATAPGRVVVRAAEGDPVAVTLTLSAQTRAGGDVRVVRDTLTARDSAWAQQGHTVVAWPSSLLAGGWLARPRPDTAFAVASVGSLAPERSAVGAATVVAPLPRLMVPPPGRVVARWADGEPAATERALGAGCIRAVGVTVPSAGDLALTPAFRRLVEHLTEPCGAAMEAAPVPDSVLVTVLAPGGRPDAGPTVAVDLAPSPLTTWLLGLALAAALAELVVRRGSNATA